MKIPEIILAFETLTGKPALRLGFDKGRSSLHSPLKPKKGRHDGLKFAFVNVSEIKYLSDTHDMFQIRAFQGVNMNLTLRNWFFGMYIVEYEQYGKDRASYGDALIKEIAKNFKNSKIKGLSFRNLNLFRLLKNH